MKRRWNLPAGICSMRAAIEFVSFKKKSLHLLDDADFFQRAQIFQDQIERDGAELRRNRIANLLGIAFAVGKVQRLVGVLFAAAPETLIVEQLGPADLRAGVIVHKVVAEDCDRAARRRSSNETNVTRGLP